VAAVAGELVVVVGVATRTTSTTRDDAARVGAATRATEMADGLVAAAEDDEAPRGVTEEYL
jgi:hypothetical protein